MRTLTKKANAVIFLTALILFICALCQQSLSLDIAVAVISSVCLPLSSIKYWRNAAHYLLAFFLIIEFFISAVIFVLTVWWIGDLVVIAGRSLNFLQHFMILFFQLLLISVALNSTKKIGEKQRFSTA